MTKLNVKDLPNYGLTILSASDPSYEAIVADSTISAEDIKGFSILIKNTSEQAVVAYKIKWEFVKADGTIFTQVTSAATSYFFMYGNPSDRQKLIARADTVIKPNTTWFISLLLPSGPVSQGNRPFLEQSDEDPNYVAFIKSANSEFAQYSNVTVSIDGAFLEDGRFVGPNTTNYFEEIQAHVNARHDVLMMVKRSIEEGMARDQIFQSVEQLASTPEIELGAEATTSDYYEFNKRLFARDTFGRRTVFGVDEATKQVLKDLSEPWIILRKVSGE